MLTDPQSITISAIANSLPAVVRGVNSSTYRKDDETVELVISSQYGNRKRRTGRVNFKKVAPDPLDSSVNLEYSLSVYLVVDVPKIGFTVAEQKAVVDGFLAYLTASSGAKITSILGGES